MSNHDIIFNVARPMLKPPRFAAPGLIDALDDACERLPHEPNNSIIFETLRPHMDGPFTPERIKALDDACEALRDAAEADDPAIAAGWWSGAAEAGTALGGAAAVLAAPDGDDRYLPLFQRLASAKAHPDAVKAMARSFAAHAPAYGQDKTKERIADFVAQLANETGGFRAFVEDLRYRATTMRSQWPSHFTPAQAAAAVGNPVEIASRAYGGRMGNAPYPSRDGYTYFGRGGLALTGRANYRRFGQLLNLPLEEKPEMAADPAISVLIALEFYKQGNVNRYIDAGNTKGARGITNAGDPNFAHPIGLEHVNELRAVALRGL